MAVVDIFKNQYQSYTQILNKWFVPWYPEDVDWTPFQSNLNGEWQVKTDQHLAGMAQACVEDMESIWHTKLDFSPESIALLDQWITPSWRQVLQQDADPNTFANKFLVVVCELGAYLMQVILRNLDGETVLRAPYWDTSIIIGEREIFPFMAVIQRFSEEMNDTEALQGFYSSIQCAKL